MANVSKGDVARAQEQEANVNRELERVQERLALLMLEAEAFFLMPVRRPALQTRRFLLRTGIASASVAALRYLDLFETPK